MGVDVGKVKKLQPLYWTMQYFDTLFFSNFKVKPFDIK